MKYSTSAKTNLEDSTDTERERLADIAEHIAVQLVDLADIAEQERMFELRDAIEKAVEEADYFSLYE